MVTKGVGACEATSVARQRMLQSDLEMGKV